MTATITHFTNIKLKLQLFFQLVELEPIVETLNAVLTRNAIWIEQRNE